MIDEYVPSDDEWMVEGDEVEGTTINVDMSQPSGSQEGGVKRKRNTSNSLIKFKRF